MSTRLATGGRLIATLDNPLHPKIALRATLQSSPLLGTWLMPYRCSCTLGPGPFARAVGDAGFRILDTAAIVHCPRVSAVALAAVIQRLSASSIEDAFLRALRPFERLERLPTRHRTAHFSAIVAEAV